jgi:CubicO group peptidase (beta-lactamase class C family)
LRVRWTLLALVAAACATSGEAPLPNLQTRIDSYIETRMADLHVSGMAVAAIIDGRVVYARAFGERDIASHAPVTLDTVFPIGSATKSFTATAAVLSQDAGALSLDDHPQRYLPYFHMADAGANARVTLRDMLSHQTGLMANADLAAEPGVLTREEYIRATAGAEPVAPLRSRFQYSNAMFTAAGEAVAAANHTTWERLIETRIFAPLGMTGSTASFEALRRAPNHVTGYVYDSATHAWIARPPPATLSTLAPAGAVSSSARDMIRWLTMLAEGGQMHGRRFLSEAGFRALAAPQIAINSRLSYALGWASYSWSGLNVVEHNGGGEGISALVSFVPERRAGFILLLNRSPTSLTTIGAAARDLYPILLNMPREAEPASAPASAGAETPPPPAQENAEQLIARMIAASGGPAMLRRHQTLMLHAEKSYDNQGITAALTTLARMPAARADSETWSAAGREIARLRVYFDGAHGGQETTFGQDSVNDDAANAEARRTNALHPLLELDALYHDIAVHAGPEVDGEATEALTLGNGGETARTWIVSARSALLRRRIAGAETDDYGDYRAVDGEMLPFTTVIHDPLGKSTVRVRDARFNAPIDDASFAPHVQH